MFPIEIEIKVCFLDSKGYGKVILHGKRTIGKFSLVTYMSFIF